MNEKINLVIQFTFVIIPIIFYNKTLSFRVKTPVFDLAIFAMHAIITIFAFKFDKSVIPTAIYNIIYFILVMSLSNNSFKIKLLAFVTNFVCLVSADIFACVFINCFSEEIKTNHPLAFTPVAYVFFALVLYYYSRVINSIKQYDRLGNWIAFIILPMLKSTAILFVCYVFVFSQHDDTFFHQWMINVNLPVGLDVILCALTVLSISSDFIVFQVFRKSLLAEKLQADNDILKTEADLTLKYYSEIEDSIRETNKIRHDFNNTLQSIEILLSSSAPEKREEVQKLYDELKNSINNIKLRNYCSNKLINAILSSVSDTCDRESIVFNVDIKNFDASNITDIDLCRMLTNLFDNAVEAVRGLDNADEKRIDVEIFSDEDKVYFRTRNKITDGNKKAVADKIPTTKKEKTKHGYGTKIMKELAENYGGYYELSIENDMCSAVLCVEKQKEAIVI